MNSLLLNFLFPLMISLIGCAQGPAPVVENLKWNFQSFEQLTYRYQQSTWNQAASSEKETPGTFHRLSGNLVIMRIDSSMVDWVFKNLQMNRLAITDQGDTTRLMTRQQSDMYIRAMKETGEISSPLNAQNQILGLTLFPLPDEPIRLGESSKLPIRMLFNLFGSQIEVTGYNTLSLTKIEGNELHFETVIDVSEFEVPPEVDYNYTCYLKGKSHFRFDQARGFFTGGKLEIRMFADVVPKAEATESFADQGNPQPLTQDMNIDVRSEIQLELLEVE